MRFLLLYPAALLLLAILGVRASALPDPSTKSDYLGVKSAPGNLLSGGKADSLPDKPPKSDYVHDRQPRTDSLPDKPAKSDSLAGNSAPGNLLSGGKADSLPDKPPKSDSLAGKSAPGNLLSGEKADSLPDKPPKSDSVHDRQPRTDSLHDKPPKSDSVHDRQPRTDSLPDKPAKSDSLAGKSAPGNLLSGEKADSLPDKPPKSDSVGRTPPKEDNLPSQPKKDFVMIIHHPPAPQNLDNASTEKVKELRRKLTEAREKTKELEKQSKILWTAINQAQYDVAELWQEKSVLTAQVKNTNLKLLEAQIKLTNAQQRQELCEKSGGNLPDLEVHSQVDAETRRLVEDRREPSIELSHKMKYIKLLSDLRRRIKKEIEQVSGQVEGTTKPTSPEPKGYFAPFYNK